MFLSLEYNAKKKLLAGFEGKNYLLFLSCATGSPNCDMRVIVFYFITIVIFSFSCKHRDDKNCYPDKLVAKTIVLVADTTILGRNFVPGNDTTKTYPVFNGIGFVKLNGIPVHTPLEQIILTESQQQAFLKILRPVPHQTQGTTTDCLPNFRHVVLFYDKAENLIGQMHICFGCDQVKFTPEPACLNFFDNYRMTELKHFFQANNIPLLAEN